MNELKVPPQRRKWTHSGSKLWGMTEEKRRPRPAAQYGPTAAAVGQNVKRLRDRRDLSIYALSGALERVGRPITPSAIAKIEKNQRQVSVDDLAALAIVLGVSPSALLIPFTDRPDEQVEITGGGAVPALAAWEWADGKTPIRYAPDRHPETQWREYELYGRPAWLHPFRPGGQPYSSEQFAQYNDRRNVRGGVRWNAEGQPVWDYPPEHYLKGLDERGSADGPGVD